MEDSELLSIKDFAEYTGVKESILRYYDNIGLFRPISRGENGYRYYSPLQITAFNMVSVLCDLRTALREIGGMQQTRTPQSLLAHLEKQEEEFDKEMRRLQESYSIAHMYRRFITEALAADEDAVIEQYLAEESIFIGPENQFQGTTRFFNDFTSFCRYIRKRNINLSYPIGAIFNTMDVFLQRPSMPNFFYSTDPKGFGKKAAGRYLIAYTRGYYGDKNDMPQRIAQYAKQHHLEFEGPIYTVYLLDEVSIVNPDQYLARACIRVRRGR